MLFDADGLCYADSSGTRLAGDLFAVGSGSAYAYSVLDAGYRTDLSVREAADLAAQTPEVVGLALLLGVAQLLGHGRQARLHGDERPVLVGAGRELLDTPRDLEVLDLGGTRAMHATSLQRGCSARARAEHPR